MVDNKAFRDIKPPVGFFQLATRCDEWQGLLWKSGWCAHCGNRKRSNIPRILLHDLRSLLYNILKDTSVSEGEDGVWKAARH